ncbi:hypothetical protein ScPMuIL_015019 [Solemya velum]
MSAFTFPEMLNDSPFGSTTRTKLFWDSDSNASPAKHLTFTDEDDDFQLKPISSKAYPTCAMESRLNKGHSAKQFVRKTDEGKDLIGDGSRNHTLPLETGKHTDLKCISSKTAAAVLRGDYDTEVDSVTIVDCRYPYEFNGGHIEGAINIYRQKELRDFMKDHRYKKDHTRNIVIFHCEFSSKRGPNLLRYMRNQDREMNKRTIRICSSQRSTYSVAATKTSSHNITTKLFGIPTQMPVPAKHLTFTDEDDDFQLKPISSKAYQHAQWKADSTKVTLQTAAVLRGDYDTEVDSVTIVDCRYPYEFNGGHIEGAINIYRQKELRDFMKDHRYKKDHTRNIVIFHCDFHPKRPHLLRYMRNQDREMNKRTIRICSSQRSTYSVAATKTSSTQLTTKLSGISDSNASPAKHLTFTDEDDDFSTETHFIESIPNMRNGKQTQQGHSAKQFAAAVLRGDYDTEVDSVTIVDCRYPYEFNGGHIEGAINIYRQKELRDFMKDHRLRYMRNQDREMNKENYPNLFFPEVYLLSAATKTSSHNITNYAIRIRIQQCWTHSTAVNFLTSAQNPRKARKEAEHSRDFICVSE